MNEEQREVAIDLPDLVQVLTEERDALAAQNSMLKAAVRKLQRELTGVSTNGAPAEIGR